MTETAPNTRVDDYSGRRPVGWTALEPAFAMMMSEGGAQAFVMQVDSVLFSYRGPDCRNGFEESAARPPLSRESWRRQAFLLTYGADIRDLYIVGPPFFVDKIFKGAKPADLPVEQPTKFRNC